MRKKYFGSLIIGLVFLTSLFILISNTITTFAADSDLGATDRNTISKAPTGLSMSKYFTINTPTNNSSDDTFRFRSNAAFISDNDKVIVLAHGTDTNSADNTKGSLLVSAVKNKTGSYGAAWSNANTAYFKPGKPQTISAWLSFGSNGADETINGQGMALVLQNNSDGPYEMGAGQEGLGVYGYDKSIIKFNSYSLASTTDVAKTAVQNSIALEFDTQLQDNSKNKYPKVMYSMDAVYPYYSTNSFDTKESGSPIPSGFPDDTSLGAGGSFGHIAVTYPSDPNSYYATKTPYFSDETNTNFSPFEKGYSLFHIHRQQGANLVNDTDSKGNPIVWHHVTFRWVPSDDLKTATISYSYNDKETDGTINTQTDTQKQNARIDDSVTVDMSQLGNITKDSKIYWGFTGANNNINNNVASKLVSIESIPDLVNAEVDTTITDTTLNKVMYDDPDDGSSDGTDRKVASGDDLKIDYKLTYDNGREDWQDIVSKIKLPTNVTYNTDGGKIGTIKYANGDTEDIPTSALSTDGTTIDYKILQNLGDISAKNKVADIIINGVAVNQTDEDIDVDAQPATFTGSNNISSTSTPKFTILYKKNWTLNLTNPMSDPTTLLYEQDNATLNLDTKLNYNGKTSPDFASGDKIHYKISLAGHNLTYDSLVSSNSDNLSDEIPLRKVIEDAGLDFWDLFPNNSSQEITVKAIDDDGVTSNTVTYNVNIEPNHLLELNFSNNLNFQSVNYLSTTKYIKRANDYNVSVTSYRNPWTLQAESSALTNGNDEFNGDLVNKDSDGIDILTDTPTVIATDASSYQKETTTSIPTLNKWTSDSGFLLKNDGLSSAKKYKGTLTWTISDYDDSL